MAISSKTRKILWARSGNRCAICRQELVNQTINHDGEAIIGEECHIVAREINGPRGDSPLPIDERDKPANLILLCRNHHKEVDDQPESFTVEFLKEIKLEHENWVRNKLSPDRQSIPRSFFVYRVDTGAQFCDLVIGCHVSFFNNDQPKTDEEVELIGDFAQNFQEYSDIWNVIESKARIVAQFEFDRQIRELNEGGFLVYALARRENWQMADSQKPLIFMVGYVLVLHKDNRLVKCKDDEIERLMRFDGQNPSQFTNFIPVMREPSGIRLL
jgi:hypothetical protein